MTSGQARWTPGEVGELRRLFADGASDEEIGRALGHSAVAVAVELPAGADGEPLRFGDEVEVEDAPGAWSRGVVHAVSRLGDVFVQTPDGQGFWADPPDVRHVKARTVEDVLADMAELVGREDWEERAEGLVREAYELGRRRRDE